MRIVVADDSALLREGVAGLLTRRSHEVVAQVDSADRMQGVVDTHAPDLVITHVRMPPNMRDDGLQAALDLRKRGPVNVLVLSQYVAPAYARELFSGGDGGTGISGGNHCSRFFTLHQINSDGDGGIFFPTKSFRAGLFHADDFGSLDELNPWVRETTFCSVFSEKFRRTG